LLVYAEHYELPVEQILNIIEFDVRTLILCWF